MNHGPLANALLALTSAFRLFRQTFKVSKNDTKFFLHFQSLKLLKIAIRLSNDLDDVKVN